MKKSLTLRKAIIYGLSLTILFVQEQILNVIPNFQFTTVLIVLYYQVYGFVPTLIITAFHVILDNLYMGSINILYTPIMCVGWLVLPVILELFFKRTTSEITLGIVGIGHAVVYCGAFTLANYILTNTNIFAYILADIPFLVLLMISNFITILWVLTPLKKVLSPLYRKYIKEREEHTSC